MKINLLIVFILSTIEVANAQIQQPITVVNNNLSYYPLENGGAVGIIKIGKISYYTASTTLSPAESKQYLTTIAQANRINPTYADLSVVDLNIRDNLFIGSLFNVKDTKTISIAPGIDKNFTAAITYS
jgi:hypothetical protein